MAITLTTVLHFLLALFVFALVAGAIWYLVREIVAVLPAPIGRFRGIILAFFYLLLVLAFISFLMGGWGSIHL